MAGITRAQIIPIVSSDYKISVSNQVVYYEDKTQKLTINEVKQLNNFNRITTDVPNFGISNSVFWLKLKISNQTNVGDFLLQVSHPGLDKISCYQINDDTIFSEAHSGEYNSFNHRVIRDPDYIFNLQLPSHKITTILLQVSARENIQIPIFIGTPDRISESNKKKKFSRWHIHRYNAGNVFLQCLLIRNNKR